MDDTMDFDPMPPPSVFNTQNAYIMRRLQSLHTRKDEKVSLYPHQVEAVLKLHDYFYPQRQSAPNSSKIALVVLPTGCGKTGVAVLASYALDASRVLVITPSIIISRQIHTAYGKFLIQHGVVPDRANVHQAVLPSRSLIKRSSEIREGMSSMVMVVNAHKIGGQSSVRIEDIPCDSYDLVIVDEAHHYPAPTWKLLVDHFSNSRRLFLTATPEHRGNPLLIPSCYKLERSEAVARGIIRPVKFYETNGPQDEATGPQDETTGPQDDTTGGDKEYQYSSIAKRMEQYLNKHDRDDPSVRHQGMVLAQTRVRINPAETFCDIYNRLYPDKCAVYVCKTREDIYDAFIRGDIRVLVIIGRLLEGFDHKPVSVLGIVRNIQPTSRVLFAQFVGRAVRKNSRNDPVSAQIVTHVSFNQRQNYETFEELAEDDPVGDDDDEQLA